MPALPQPMTRGGAGQASKAIQGAVRSCSATIDAHQKDRAAPRGLSHGHCVHVHSNQTKKGFSTRPAAVVDLPVNLARAPVRVLSHSHWPAVLPCMADRRAVVPSLTAARHHLPVRAFHRSARPFIPCGLNGSRRHDPQSLSHQLPINTVADRLHLSNVLSSSASFDGSETIGKAFDECAKTNCEISQK